MPIQILVIADLRVYHSSRPSTEVYVRLAQQPDFAIHYMTYGDCAYAERLREHGIEVIDFHPDRKVQPRAIRRIRQAVLDRRIDIVHLYNNYAIINGLIALANVSVKVVLYRGYAGNIHWYDPAAYTKFLNPRVDKIVCNAEGVEEVFQRQPFFDKSKTVTIHKGHDLDWYAGYEAVDVRDQLGIPRDALLLVNVAKNRRMKGIPYLLRAMNALPERANVHLVLVGPKMDTRTNLRLIRNGRPEHIHLLGFQAEPMRIVAGCDVFVLSSIKGESLTMSVIESIGVGVPAIITDIPGNRPLVEDGVSGLVVPAGDPLALRDAILKVHDNRALLPAFARNAQKHIRDKLNIKQTVEQMAALYRSLVDGN